IQRWKMINKTLDLPFDEPVETYSSSEHLYKEQGIAPGTKGRIVPEAPREPRKNDRPRPERSGSDRPRTERAPRDRNRTRTRSGGTVTTDSEVKAVAVTGAEDASTGPAADGESKPR